MAVYIFVLVLKKNQLIHVQKANGIYITFMLVTGFLIVLVCIAGIYVGKKNGLENVKNGQILFSGVAVLDLISDVNIVFIYRYIFHVNLYLL